MPVFDIQIALFKRISTGLRALVLLHLLVWLNGCALKTQQAPQTLLNDVAYASVIEIAVTEPTQIVAYGDAEAQQIWYYQANSERAFKGVVVLIHGGCWLSQFTIEHTRALSHALADEGYAIWNIEYRSTGSGGEWPIALDDIRMAIAQLPAQKGDTLDLSKVNIIGHSAGGHLAMLASAAPEFLGLPKYAKVKTVGLAPIVDIEAYSLGENSCQTATPRFMQGSAQDRPNEYLQASVLNYRLNPALSYVLVGGNDSIVPPEFSEHPDTQQVIIAEAGHFDWIHPGTAAFKQLTRILAK